MKKLDLNDLVVSTFEVQAPVEEPYVNLDPTPDTRCFVCGYTDVSCDFICPDSFGGGSL